MYTDLRMPTVQSQCSGFRPFVTGSDESYTHILLFTYLFLTQQFIIYLYTLFIYLSTFLFLYVTLRYFSLC